MASTFTDRLNAGEILISDGASGTNLQKMGLPVGVPPDAWVFEEPDKVLALHQAFVDAGSDIILTNTFGATRIRLGETPYVDQAQDLNRRAVELAQKAAQTGTGVLVAGSMGPTGMLMQPFGELTPQSAMESYAEQARTLSEAGVDLLLVETMFAIDEALAAIEGVRQACDLPLVCSFSFDRGVHTMMGVTPEKVVDSYQEYGLTAVGANCGRSLEDMGQVLEQYKNASSGLPLWIKPNAGLPHDHGQGAEWDLTPQEMGTWVAGFVRAGAGIVGGCCGTSPDHVRAIADAVHAL